MVSTRRQNVRRLSSAPLVMVLCDVRFAPVLTMEKHVATIQDILRRSGYPGYDQAVMQQFELVVDGPPKLSSDTRWFFRSKDRKRIASLTTSAVTVQVTDYSQFESFLEILEPVINAVQQIAEPAFHERIGLRYVNAIENAGGNLDQMFRETVLSFTAEDLGVSSLLTTQQAIGRTAAGQIVFRMNQVEDTPLLPLDLLSPEFPELSRPRSGVHAILDIDGSEMQVGDFEYEAIETRLWNIHECTERVFWQSTKPEAHQQWGLINDDGRTE